MNLLNYLCNHYLFSFFFASALRQASFSGVAKADSCHAKRMLTKANGITPRYPVASTPPVCKATFIVVKGYAAIVASQNAHDHSHPVAVVYSAPANGILKIALRRTPE